MKLLWKVWYNIALCSLLASASLDYIVKRERNGYTVYQYAIFKKQTGDITHAIPRQMTRPLPFSREQIIIDLPPLESRVKIGDSVLVRMGSNKYGTDIYSPAKVLKIDDDDDKYYHIKPVCDMKAPPVGIYDVFIHHRVPDSSFTSISDHEGKSFAAHYARLYMNEKHHGWCPLFKDFGNAWLQIDLKKFYFICSVKTSGLDSERYTLLYEMLLSADGSDWEYARDKDDNIKFFGRFPSPKADHQIVGMVEKPYRYIKFFIISFMGWPCLNVEVYGHQLKQRLVNRPLSFPLRYLRLEGGVCNLQTRCQQTPNAECASEGIQPGTYKCRCKPGFQGPRVFEPLDFATCSDINECSKNACDSRSNSCTNTHGSYLCTCKQGYVNEKQDRTKCRDLDECSEKNPCSPHAKCTNTDGSYSCDCKFGFIGNGFKCSDVNECKPNGGKRCLSHYADCINTPGSYKCSCWKGYTGDGDTCSDINECTANPCKKMNGLCMNIIGSFLCKCKSGFKFVDKVCIDVDECKSRDLNDCSQSAACVNLPGTYTCQCSQGYTGKGYDTYGCTDIDECANKNICGSNSRCKNTQGSYQCSCEPGYSSKDNKHCKDIDECGNSPVCHTTAICTNIPGSFQCACAKGFTGSGLLSSKGCTKLTWCESQGAELCKHKICDNKTRKCTDCKPGFVESKGTCKDINECDAKPCGNGHCTNQPGSYTCKCKTGYHFVKKHKKCHDIDECSETKDVCHADGACLNTQGSYECKCNKGFDGDGLHCADVNECYNGDYKCPSNSVCYNTIGSYKCLCKKGYHRKGSKCLEGGEEEDEGGFVSLYSKVLFWRNNSGTAKSSLCILAMLMATAFVVLRNNFQ